ncbi:MAG: hypothetical protein ACTHJR_12275 [Sphingomonas sp.]|uniref:hypothetical protein n=1 Tax=Sphingomonas sp. TaxID=28214 RepID=UPI003F7E2D4F
MICSPYATRLTVFGVLNPDNNKPFRSRALRQQARDTSVIREDGAFDATDVPVKYHPETKYKPSKTERRHASRYFRACNQEGKAVAILSDDN